MSPVEENLDALDELCSGFTEYAAHLLDVGAEHQIPIPSREETDSQLDIIVGEMLRPALERAAAKETPQKETDLYVLMVSAYAKKKFYAEFDRLVALRGAWPVDVNYGRPN